MVQQANTAKKTEAESKAPESVVQAPAPAPSTTGQSSALRQDTKIAGRTGKAFESIKEAPKGSTMSVKDLKVAPEASVRSAAKGVMFVSPGAYMIALGPVEPSSKAPQAQLAVEVAKRLGATKEVGVDLHHLQHEYVKAKGTDLSIFTGRTRLYSNGGKCNSAMVDGKKVPQAPLTAYLTPAPVQETVAAAVEGAETKELAETAKK